MSTSSIQLPAERYREYVERQQRAYQELYECPDWCRRGDHHEEYLAPGDVSYHDGPWFGLVELESFGDEPATARLAEYYDMTGADLRQLAADAHTAADWLERRRSAGHAPAARLTVENERRNP